MKSLHLFSRNTSAKGKKGAWEQHSLRNAHGKDGFELGCERAFRQIGCRKTVLTPVLLIHSTGVVPGRQQDHS